MIPDHVSQDSATVANCQAIGCYAEPFLRYITHVLEPQKINF